MKERESKKSNHWNEKEITEQSHRIEEREREREMTRKRGRGKTFIFIVFQTPFEEKERERVGMLMMVRVVQFSCRSFFTRE